MRAGDPFQTKSTHNCPYVSTSLKLHLQEAALKSGAVPY